MAEPIPQIDEPAGPFDQDRLRRLLEEAGFAEVRVSELAVPSRNESFEAWWTRTCSLAGPLTARLAGLDDQQRTALRERARRAARPYEKADGLDFPGIALVASSHR